jgi:hypothetical protein
MNRRKLLASAVGGVAGLCCFGSGLSVASDAANRIRTVTSYTIDERFGNAERRLLTTGRGGFFERFLKPYYPISGNRYIKWNYGGSDVTSKHMTDFSNSSN